MNETKTIAVVIVLYPLMKVIVALFNSIKQKKVRNLAFVCDIFFLLVAGVYFYYVFSY